MNFSDNGPLYPKDRPFYYDPEITPETKQDDESLTMTRLFILFILSPFLLLVFVVIAVFDWISTIIKR